MATQTHKPNDASPPADRQRETHPDRPADDRGRANKPATEVRKPTDDGDPEADPALVDGSARSRTARPARE